MYAKVTLYFFTAVLVAGCTTNSISTRLQATLAAATTTGPVECTGCKAEWERAQLWLTRHSKWKMQTATDVVLQTFSPVNYDVSYGFTITKEPVLEGKYRIKLAMACGNPLGCDPAPSDVGRAFYHYVATGVDVLEGLGYLGSIR